MILDRCRRIAFPVLLTAVAGCSALLDDEPSPPPRVELGVPGVEASVDADSIRIQGAAHSRNGVQRITLQVNDGAEQPVEVSPARDVSFTAVARPLIPGSNQLVVRAYDADGRQGSVLVRVVARDTVPPTLVILAPEADGFLNRDSVPVALRITDNWRVSGAWYVLDQGAEVALPLPTAADSGRVTFSIPEPAPGRHTVRIRGTDPAGNTVTAERTFEVATTRVRIVEPVEGALIERYWAGVFVSVEPRNISKLLSVAVNGVPQVSSFYSGLLFGEREEAQPAPDLLVVRALSLPEGEVRLRVDVIEGESRKRIGTASVRVHVRVPARTYTVTRVGTLGGRESHGEDLNEQGEVVGWSYTASGAVHAFLWSGGTLSDLGTSLGTESRAVGIAADGTVVGNYVDGCPRAFRRPPGASASTLGLECGYRAVDINDRGTVLVFRNAADYSETYAVEPALLRDGAMHPLRLTPAPITGPDRFRGVLRINNSDQVLAKYWGGPGWPYTGIVHPQAAPRLIGAMEGRDMNEGGRTVLPPMGLYDYHLHEVRLTNPTEYLPSLDLGPPKATALNNLNQVAGTYLHGSPGAVPERAVREPFLWDAGRLYRIVLSDPSWRVDEIVRIADSGLILANATDVRTGEQSAILLRPTP